MFDLGFCMDSIIAHHTKSQSPPQLQVELYDYNS